MMGPLHFRYLAFGSVVSAVLALSACGNDPTAGTATRAVLAVAQQTIAGKKDTAAAPSVAPEALAIAARKAFPGAIQLAQVESLVSTPTVIGEYGRNGAYRTYSAPDKRTFVFRSGILTATRGFGHDLMSSDLGASESLIVARRSGSASRKWRYLDGEGTERPLRMSCTVTAGGAHNYSFAGENFATRKMDETCNGGGLAITNTYWVTANGTIALSRQWIGPQRGHVTLQLVRQ